MKRPEIPALTGLRGLAALLVVWNHYFHWCAPFPVETAPPWLNVLFNTSDVGMTLFFVLSGFVITYNYADLNWRGDFRAAFAQFAWMRFSRLYPLLAVFILLRLGRHWPDWLTGLHILAVQTWVPLPAEQTIRGPYGVSWSISTEVGMYLMFALLMVLHKRARLVAIVLYIGAIALISATLDDGPTAYWFFYLSPYFRFLEFGAGAMLAFCTTRGYISIRTSRSMPRLLSSQPMIFIGNISYSIYLLHGAIAAWIADGLGLRLFNVTKSDYATASIAPLMSNIIVGMCLSFLIASIGYLAIETPAKLILRRLGDGIRGAAPVPAR